MSKTDKQKRKYYTVYKLGEDISKYINYKFKYLNLQKILKTNLKWFKKYINQDQKILNYF